MDPKLIELLAKLGLLEVLQSYLEGDEHYNSFYWREDESIEDDFFKEAIKELEE